MLIQVTPPAVQPVTEAEVWDFLRVPLLGDPAEPEDKDTIADMLAAAVAHFDGRDGVLGRQLVTATWRLDLDGFPACGEAIRLPLPPLQLVESVTYTDASGDVRTLPATDYTVAGIGGDAGRIQPAYGKSWPSTRRVPEAVSVTFRCGYGNTGDDVPAPIRSAIMQTVATRYENREDVVIGLSVSELPEGAAEIVAAYREWSF